MHMVPAQGGPPKPTGKGVFIISVIFTWYKVMKTRYFIWLGTMGIHSFYIEFFKLQRYFQKKIIICRITLWQN